MQENCTILPLIDSSDGSAILHTHVQDLIEAAYELLSTHTSFPLIEWKIPDTAPGATLFYLVTKRVKDHDLAEFFSEMVGHWAVPGREIQLLSTRSLPLHLSDENKEFIIVELIAYIEDDTTLQHVRKNIKALAEEISLGCVSTLHARHILAMKGMTLDQKTMQVHRAILHFAKSRLKPIAAELFFEMQYVLLATDGEFKRIRSIRHLLRMICHGNWLRRSFKGVKTVITDQRKVIVKLSRESLQFAFGEKKVLSVSIAINFIKEYERFDEKHIVKACQKIIPHVRAVPHSYFTYASTADAVHIYYVEFEKKDGTEFSFDEFASLKAGLGNEVVTSIEQLSHRLFMPHNEEEVLRSILLLSREIRYVHDIPQVTISFQSQSETTITFLIILVRILKHRDVASIDSLFKQKFEFMTFVHGSKKIVGKLRNKYAKEANTFLLECQKAPFLRQDHSVDLSRARQFVASSISEIIGEIRDFNGGLILQQNQLLLGLKMLLTPQEVTYELHLENLFHAITPILMKSLLSPELIRGLFQLFLKMLEDSSSIKWQEYRQDSAIAVMVRMKDCHACEHIENEINALQLKELELAHTTFRAGGVRYRGYIILSNSEEKLQKLKLILDMYVIASTRGETEQVLKISLPRPTSLLDPRIGTDRTSGIVIKMLYEGLMRIDPSGKPVPAAAQSYHTTEDKRCYIFTLRPTKWSNGKPVCAHDFEYAWRKSLDPKFTSIFAYLFYPIKNARAIKKGELPMDQLGVTVLDDRTLKVELEHPSPFFLELTSHWAYSPLCREVDERHPGWAYYGGDTYVCNGPFRLAKWNRNAEIQAVKNNQYWDKHSVHLNQIDISIIENPKTALHMYKKGELDWIGEPLSEIPPEALRVKNSCEKIYSHPISAVHWYACNVQALPFTTPTLRRAFAMAINRKKIISEILEGGETPAYSILPSHLSLTKLPFFQDEDEEVVQKTFYDGLREIGLTKKSLPRITITCSDQELHGSIAHAVASRWKEVLDVDVHIESFKWDQYMQKGVQHNFQVMATTWYSWYNDPIYKLGQIKYKTGDMNMTQWQNEEYITLVNLAEECLDMEKRRALLRSAEKIVMEEMPIIPLFCYTFRYMKKENIRDIYLSHLGQIDFKWAKIIDKKGV